MNASKNNERGFSALHLVLLLVIAVAVVGTGWYVYNAGNKANSNLDKADDSASVTTKKVTSTAPTKSTSTKSDVTASWLKFDHPAGDYSIRLIDGWKFTLQDNYLIYLSCTAENLDSCTYKQGTAATITKVSGGRDGLTGLMISSGSTTDPPVGEKDGDVQAANATGAKYVERITEDQMIGAPKGTKTSRYYFQHNGKKVVISYDLTPGTIDQTALVEKMIGTLTIN